MDLDIDAVTLIGSEFSPSGKYITWSPFFRMSNIEILKASQKLPYPTGTAILPAISTKNWFTEFANFIYIPPIELEDGRKQADSELHKDAPLMLSEDGQSFRVRLRTPEQIKRFSQLINRINKEGISENLSENVEGVNMDQVHQQERAGEFNRTAPDWLKRVIKTENLESLRDSLIELINRHNTFLNNKPTLYKRAALQNQAQYRMYKTAESPSNLTEGTESIDFSTQPLKDAAEESELAKEDNKAAPGSTWLKHSQFIQGQVGKQCVGIGAVAIKINSATQFFFDITLNGDNEAEKTRLIIPADKLPTINGRTYKSIANIYDRSVEYNGTSAQTNPELKNLVDELQSNIGFEDDVAINLAAFLSIAVDNAKELALAKLNAAPLMLGLYDYGISLGIPVEELISIINSETANIITDYAQSNILENDKGKSRAIQAIQIFEGKIGDILKSFDKGLWTPGLIEGSTVSIKSVSDVLLALTEGENNSRNLAERIYNLAKLKRLTNIIEKDSKGILKKVFNLCKIASEARIKMSDISLEERIAPQAFEASLNGLIKWCEQYQFDLTRMNDGTLKDIRTLAEGGEEMRILGRFLSSNNGLKTKDVEALKFISLLENSIFDRINARKMTDKDKELELKRVAAKFGLPENCKIDFVRFFYDETYQENCINAYDEVKHTTNILAVIAKVHHFTGYMRTTALPYAAIQSASSRFRAKIKYGSDEHIQKVFGNSLPTNTKDAVRANLDTLINMKYLTGALADRHVTFTMPVGMEMFNSRLEKVPSQGQPIALYTEEGLATFKMFMETYVIPKLKNDPRMKNNQFVQGLTPIELTRTMSRRPSLVYSMEGTLLPHSDSEQVLFDEYKSDFDLLKSEDYEKSLGLPEGGNINTLHDAFYIYTQYCFGGKKGPRSLLALFDTSSADEVWTKGILMNYIADFDQNKDLAITDEEFISYCAPTLSRYQSSSKFAYIRNDNNFDLVLSKYSSDRELQQRLGDDEDGEYTPSNWFAWFDYTGNREESRYQRALADINEANRMSNEERSQYFIYPNVKKELPNYQYELSLKEYPLAVQFELDPKTGRMIYDPKTLSEAIFMSLDWIAQPLYSDNLKQDDKIAQLITEKTKEIMEVVKTHPTFMVAPRASKDGTIRQCIVPKIFEDLIQQKSDEISCSL